LIIDDTIEEKPYTDENEIICWHFSHAKGRCIKGVNLLSGQVLAITPDTLQVDLDSPDTFFLEKLTYPIFFPLCDKEEPSKFNGPYLIKETKEREIILEKNPFYWDFKTLFFDEIRIQFERCPQRTHSLFKQGQIDWLGDPLSLYPSDGSSLTTTTLSWKSQFFIHFNTKHPFLSSPSIRQAFNAVIDRKWIIKHFFKESTPAFTLFNNTPSLPSRSFKNENANKGQEWFLEGLKKIKSFEKRPSCFDFYTC